MITGILYLHLVAVILFALLYLFRYLALALFYDWRTITLKKWFKKLPIILASIILVTGIILGIYKYKYILDRYFLLKLLLIGASIWLGLRGLKRYDRNMTFVGLLVLAGSFWMAEKYRKHQVKRPDLFFAETITGEQLYKNMECDACHGMDGKKCSWGAKDLSKSVLSSHAAYFRIMKGRCLMPAYMGAITDVECTTLISYLFSLRPPDAPRNNVDEGE